MLQNASFQLLKRPQHRIRIVAIDAGLLPNRSSRTCKLLLMLLLLLLLLPRQLVLADLHIVDEMVEFAFSSRLPEGK